MYFLKTQIPGEVKSFLSCFKLCFNLQGLVAENAWLGAQLEEAKESLAGCLGVLYPLELLWALLALLSFHLVVDAGRVLWHRIYPADMFPGDM